MTHPPPDFDPLQPETFDSAHADYARLRAQCPVARAQAYGGFWALARHADVTRVLTEVDTFITSQQNVVPKVAFTGRRPPLHLDPPEHTPYRAVLNPLLTPERAALLEPAVREYTLHFLLPLLRAGRGDLCQDFAAHVPVRVFGHWMKLPPALEAALGEAAPAFVRAVQSAEADAMKSASLVLYDMARELIGLRRCEPLDPAEDPTSAMLAARIDGEPMSDEMAVGMVRQVLVVGIVAPMVMMGSIAVHLSRHPALQERLRREPQHSAAAVEEFLRLYTPYRGFARTARCPVQIGGRTIPAGEPIALLYASANRDEAVFEHSDQFVLDRPNIKDHIAFGRGPHYCAGAALARLELRVMLEELLARTRHFEVDGELVMTPFPEIGPWQVPVRFTCG
ncbi:MAG: cytochrome P450 [Burkholderiales bacterium]|nr:cytochrome P450 [Burkholderiales bacterium]